MFEKDKNRNKSVKSKYLPESSFPLSLKKGDVAIFWKITRSARI